MEKNKYADIVAAHYDKNTHRLNGVELYSVWSSAVFADEEKAFFDALESKKSGLANAFKKFVSMYRVRA